MAQRLSDLTDAIVDYRHRRSLARAVVAMATGGPDARAIAKSRWPNDNAAHEMVLKGAVSPASTSSVTAFGQTSVSSVISILAPTSASAAIFARALGLSFGREHGILVPTVSASASAVTFVAEAAPIPVRQLDLSGPILTPKKASVIIPLTRELVESSNADTLARAVIMEDLTLGLDTILLDATAGDTLRPAGLRNGIAALTATSGGDLLAMNSDLANLAGAVSGVANDQIIYVASPKQAVKIALMRTAPMPYPVLSSAGLEDGVVMALAPGALAVAGSNDAPRISVSSVATMHMEDTNPAQIGTAGTPNIVAAPTRSLWQTDTIGLKMTADITWALRASGAVAWTQSVTW